MATAAQPATATEVFYSYCHKDEDLRDELERHLSILKRSGVIQGWHDRKIDAGSEWAGRIHEHLDRAHVILLLISADFLASDYCWDVELKRAMERHEAGEAVVIPIILRPVDWSGAPFAKVQCLPTDARPVTSWPNRDEAFRDVAEGIRRAILKASRPPGAEVQERALDAAIPASVPVGRSTELLILVRAIASLGLKAVLQVEESHDATEQDVRSKPFRLEFPRNSQGGLDPQVLTVRVESGDFDVPQPAKQIRVPPDGDSETCVFLVTARRAGELALLVEVLHEGISTASRLLRTSADEAPQFIGSGTFRLASLPLTAYAYRGGPAEGLPPLVRQPSPSVPPLGAGPGEFTRLFRQPPAAGSPSSAPTSPATPAPPAGKEPGEFTRLFQQPAATGAPPTGSTSDEFRRLFERPSPAPLPPASASPPAGSEPNEFTRLFEQPPPAPAAPAAPQAEEVRRKAEAEREAREQAAEREEARRKERIDAVRRPMAEAERKALEQGAREISEVRRQKAEAECEAREQAAREKAEAERRAREISEARRPMAEAQACESRRGGASTPAAGLPPRANAPGLRLVLAAVLLLGILLVVYFAIGR